MAPQIGRSIGTLAAIFLLSSYCEIYQVSAKDVVNTGFSVSPLDLNNLKREPLFRETN